MSASQTIAEERSLRILHVDDDSSLLEISKQILLVQEKFEIDFASSVNEAFIKLERKKYDAIISDYEMPTKNGLDFLKQLRERKSWIPFILFTGKGREEIAIKALNLGADGYYNKQGNPETVYGELAHGVKSAVNAYKTKLALQESEEKFRAIFENVLDVVTYVDTKGKMLDVNDRVEDLLGYTREDIVGKHFARLGLVSFTQLPKLLKLFFSTIRRGEAQGIIELELKHKNGKKVPVEVGTRFIRNKNGKIVGVVNIFRDITERKKAQEKIEENLAKLESVNEKLKVIGSLTRHDVRNKLMVARSNAHLLRKRLCQLELVQYIDAIEAAIRQSDELFEFSHLYEQIGVEKRTEISVAYCFSQAANLVANLKPKVINNCQGLTVIADTMLMQLFYNLIDNSVKHGKTVTEIRLNYTRHKKSTNLIYEDNGMGIDKANKEKIFEGFTTGGSGLGLKLVKKMIETYGWTIQENGTFGKGARFQITIPTENSIIEEPNILVLKDSESNLTAKVCAPLEVIRSYSIMH